MDSEEFVGVIKRVVRDSAVSDTIKLLEAPPGRRPAAELVANSRWYKTLDSEQRQILVTVLREAADQAVFGFFCVIDGVRAIENGPDKGTLELRYIKNDPFVLNPPDGEMLHDLFNAS